MNAKEGASRKPVGTREWYDFIAQLSAVLPAIHLGGQEATRALLAMCRLEADTQVLDVGCGPGNTACLIAQQHGSSVQGIDISEPMIVQARDKAHRLGVSGRVAFRVADVFHLPYGEHAIDVLIAESVLTPLPGNKQQALLEMARVVRPGGQLGVNESIVDPSAPPEMAALMAAHPAVYGAFTAQSLRGLFEESGLIVAQMTETWDSGNGGALSILGLRGLLSFLIRAYPKILLKLLRDGRFRKASRIDDQVTKQFRNFMGFCLMVAQKPG